jgi:hypothetical protein
VVWDLVYVLKLGYRWVNLHLSGIKYYINIYIFNKMDIRFNYIFVVNNLMFSSINFHKFSVFYH